MVAFATASFGLTPSTRRSCSWGEVVGRRRRRAARGGRAARRATARWPGVWPGAGTAIDAAVGGQRRGGSRRRRPAARRASRGRGRTKAAGSGWRASAPGEPRGGPRRRRRPRGPTRRPARGATWGRPSTWSPWTWVRIYARDVPRPVAGNVAQLPVQLVLARDVELRERRVAHVVDLAGVDEDPALARMRDQPGVDRQVPGHRALGHELGAPRAARCLHRAAWRAWIWTWPVVRGWIVRVGAWS